MKFNDIKKTVYAAAMAVLEEELAPKKAAAVSKAVAEKAAAGLEGDDLDDRDLLLEKITALFQTPKKKAAAPRKAAATKKKTAKKKATKKKAAKKKARRGGTRDVTDKSRDMMSLKASVRWALRRQAAGKQTAEDKAFLKKHPDLVKAARKADDAKADDDKRQPKGTKAKDDAAKRSAAAKKGAATRAAKKAAEAAEADAKTPAPPPAAPPANGGQLPI